MNEIKCPWCGESWISPPAVQVEPTDQLIARLRSLASELDADDSPEQIHPGAVICSQAADLIEAFQLQRDLDGSAWARHVERMRLAEAEVQRLNAALAQRTEPPQPCCGEWMTCQQRCLPLARWWRSEALRLMDQPQQQVDEFIAKQRPLPPEMAKVLADNIESLYEGEPQQQVRSAEWLESASEDFVRQQQAEPVALERWGMKSPSTWPFFEKVDDGYWTPWHIANEALQRAAPPAVNPAPGYCPHCKQYTIEEPLPADDARSDHPVFDQAMQNLRSADDEAVRLLRRARDYTDTYAATGKIGRGLIAAIDAYLAKVTR